ncbi:glycosyltransferase [Clostridium sp.]|uniref:glycosyltransferase n=1 Tax=Clostridium sp. TaxID=1506 RepID=UPI003995BC9B
MKISIICPLYNAKSYLKLLHEKLLLQEKINDYEVEIRYVLTECKDDTEDILKNLKANYKKIKKEEFSHSKTREEMAFSSDGDIIVFISQDIKIKNDQWLKKLVLPIINGEAEASFSRQLAENNTIEKYIREKNYPKESRIVSKADIERLGILTFFYSDASSAVKASIYKELNGYDGKNLTISEDMYLAEKLINAGYKIKYCGDSEIYHSHVFTLKELYKRYFDTGVFFKQNSQFLNYKSNESGVALAKYVFKAALKEKNIGVLINILPNFGARFIGSELGKRYDKLSKSFVNKSSLSGKVYDFDK